MRTRYLFNLGLILLAGFVVVISQGLGAGPVGWVTFGAGIVFLALAAGGVLARGHGIVQRGLDAAIAVLGAWTIVESVVFAGSTVIWLSFSAALGVLALAVAGLTAHELSTERVVHSLDVGETGRTSVAPSANNGRERERIAA